MYQESNIFLKVYLFVFEREKEISHLLVHFLNDYNSWSKPNQSWEPEGASSKTSAGARGLEPSSAACSVLSWELDWMWSLQDQNWHPEWDAGAAGGGLAYCATALWAVSFNLVQILDLTQEILRTHSTLGRGY